MGYVGLKVTVLWILSRDLIVTIKSKNPTNVAFTANVKRLSSDPCRVPKGSGLVHVAPGKK